MSDTNETRIYELTERMAFLEQIVKTQAERDVSIDQRLTQTTQDFNTRIDLHEQKDFARYKELSTKLDSLIKARTREAGFIGGVLFVGSLLSTLVALSGLKIIDFFK